MKYIVVKKHISNYPNPITLRKGEKVIVGKKYVGNENWSNWIYCFKLDKSQEGWVPRDILIPFNNIEYKTTLECITKEDLKGFFVGWRKPLTNEEHYEILKNSEFIVLAYDKNQRKIVGFINALSDKVNFAFIPMLEVLPEYQNQGIGSNLVRIMLNLLDDITCIDLTCDPDMQGFYERFGMMKSHGMVIRKYLK